MQKSFSHSDATIFYRKIGNGPTVVLIHGFGEDGRIWDQQIDYLKNYCQLIVPDLPGSGLSIFTNNTAINKEASKIEYYAEIINNLLEKENIHSCILLGHSLGGYITLAFAEKYPEKLQAFGLVHSTAFADSEEKKNNRQKGIELIKEYGAYSFIKNTTPSLFASKFKKEHYDQIEVLINRGKKFLPVALEQYYLAMMNRPERTSVLKTNELPVLFVIGKEDLAAPVNDLLQQVYLPQVSYIHILDEVGHMSMLEAPEILNKHLLAFIKAMN